MTPQGSSASFSHKQNGRWMNDTRNSSVKEAANCRRSRFNAPTTTSIRKSNQTLMDVQISGISAVACKLVNVFIKEVGHPSAAAHPAPCFHPSSQLPEEKIRNTIQITAMPSFLSSSWPLATLIRLRCWSLGQLNSTVDGGYGSSLTDLLVRPGRQLWGDPVTFH